ncbi:hypothetical protein OK016_12630 [Vibrio chagasii]|nr:hypothetical protein [Vibrio chagasii]
MSEFIYLKKKAALLKVVSCSCDEYGDIVETEAIDADIQLVIKHQFRTRQTNLCSDAIPL